MKQISVVLGVVLFVFSSVSQAAVLQGTCGDHWLSLSFQADLSVVEGTMVFAGDSEMRGSLSIQKVVISPDLIFFSPRGAYLRIEGTQKTSYQGFFSADGKKSSEIFVGDCSIQRQN